MRDSEGCSAVTRKVRADVTSAADRRCLIDTVIGSSGRLDVLVNTVGEFSRERARFADYDAERIESLVTSNFTSAMMLDLLALPHLRKSQAGRIIHFGFGRAAEAPAWPQRAVYAAAKAGLMSFTKTLAAEEIAHHVTVNMVCPGEIKGRNKELTINEVRGTDDPENPGVRLGAGEDVARVVAFLCELDSEYLTGTVIDVAGGLDPIRALKTATK